MNAEINGVNYYYEWLSYQKDRATLVCFHGFTGSSQTFVPVFQHKNDHNILLIDLIGHGQTDCYVHPYRYQLESLCRDIALLTETLGISRFSLLGYSMGARAALGFCCLFPNKVQKLILESGSPGLKSPLERAKRQLSDERLAAKTLTSSIEAFVTKWEALPLFNTQNSLPKNVQMVVREERLSQQPFGLACSLWFMGTGAQKNFWPELTHITIPVLLIVGELDTKFQQIADQMKQRQVTFSIKTVSDAGHCVHLEKPQQFEKIVYDFLKGGSNSDN
ncbi:2-succinyl-6-hydroxy-2,4-cyclohexadiene-1-carboxylate synthase [Enterococcus termitis]|uniref:Putative 2-succinyl-6-hydroxy-2,4-cyclohexadiene-1-carboxylate synthase n=1 Tax=Enterococcus termitis TaxID=332950 RepID=A0A1E5GW08_9ENTE|nr:2-succinyl-6-hydroxy-2,4-cyclohexadiene-1-carboxylate synthase [Enterococcus termitis]OEG16878.1 2-succinyl-6-hydroxy-2,4-cyclohexadiene-1-carboxylate synthase [Enterococcus termitis]OJG99594.1 2-succinyl-6-hydroxy-2,4-cyclohexadiene-1-carboxylate synthase [Enterococcus termitis]